MLYCQQCGAGNGGDARFCNQCGSKIAGAGEPGGPIAGPEEEAAPPATVPSATEASVVEPPKTAAATMPGHGESSKITAAEEEPKDEPAPPRKSRPSEERVSAPYPSQQNVDISTVSLSAIGVKSRGKAWITMIAIVLALVGLGAVGMWIAMSAQDDSGQAQAQGEEPPPPDSVPPDEAVPEGGEIEIGDPLPEGTDPDDIIAGTPRRRTGEAAPEQATGERQPTKRPAQGTPSEGGSVPEPWTNEPGRQAANEPTGDRPTGGQEPAGGGREGTPNTIPDDEGAPDWDSMEAEDPEMDQYSAHVRNVIRNYYMRRAQTCFDMATRNNASVRGTVVIGFDIQADGHIRNTSVERNTTGIDPLGRCLATQVGGWQLPRPPAGSAPLAMQMPFSR